MAIAHLSTGVVQRSAGQTAVHAAAYAARARMVDERTGTVYDYSRKNADVMFSFVGLPKGAPDRLRDPAAFANALERRENRVNSQTARKFIMALPSELTEQQREFLVKDFGRENFARKGLAYHVAIHKPHSHGDHRNFHAHWTVAMRRMEKGVFTERDRESNAKQALLEWRDNWEKLVNRHLERHGHSARISMKTLKAQGIDRTPQIHLGQGASALERKGKVTSRGDLLRGIANDNAREPDPEPEFVDRDQQDAAWQASIESAAIAYAEEQRRQLMSVQATTRAAIEAQGEAMQLRQATAWGEVVQRHAAEIAAIYATAPAGYQPGTAEEAVQAAESGATFFLSLFTAWAESITRSISGDTKGRAQPRQRRGPDKAKQEQAARQAEQQKEAQSRELEAMLQEQARERAAFEQRRARMLFQQAGAMQHFEQSLQDKSSLREAFERHTEIIDAYKAAAAARPLPSRERDGLGFELG